jgi:Metallo-beta-lactamase superfamily
MKRLHRDDLFGWSVFQESLELDFNSVVWVRPGGNVLVDPLPLSAHDEQHLASLGGAAVILLTNSMHVRGAAALAAKFGAKVLGPRAERETFPMPCDGWLGDGDEPVSGLRVFELDGSKTPGELAFVLEGSTLIAGDLIRAHRPDVLNLLPPQKLKNREAAIASIRRLPAVETVLVGDGWHVFHGAANQLAALL